MFADVPDIATTINSGLIVNRLGRGGCLSQQDLPGVRPLAYKHKKRRKEFT
jgi:hypothetical protein